MSMLGLVLSVERFSGESLREHQKQRLQELMLRYLFRGTTQTEIRRILKAERLEFDVRGWSESSKSDGTLLVDCKLYTYMRATLGKEHADAIPINEVDKKACLLALKSSPALVQLLQDLHRQQNYAALSLENFQFVIEQVLQASDLQAFIQYKISRKLAFLFKNSGHLSRDMFIAELRNQAIYALYKAYPRFGTIGQMLAISKSAINNHTTNLIEKYTAEKTAPWERDANGKFITSKEVSIDHSPLAMMHIHEGEHLGNSLIVTGLDGNATAHHRDDEGKVEAFISDVVNDREARQVVRLVSGVYDPGFSAFLGEDNQECSDRVRIDYYIGRVSSYLGIDRNSIHSILRESYNRMYA